MIVFWLGPESLRGSNYRFTHCKISLGSQETKQKLSRLLKQAVCKHLKLNWLVYLTVVMNGRNSTPWTASHRAEQHGKGPFGPPGPCWLGWHAELVTFACIWPMVLKNWVMPNNIINYCISNSYRVSVYWHCCADFFFPPPINSIIILLIILQIWLSNSIISHFLNKH